MKLSDFTTESFKHYTVKHKRSGKEYKVTAMHKNSALDKARAQHGGTASRYTGTSTSDFEIVEGKKKQVKANSKKPKLIKPNTGHESPHPYQGKLVGEQKNKMPKQSNPVAKHSRNKSGAGAHKSIKDYDRKKEKQDLKKMNFDEGEFVASKSAFNKNPKINYTHEDIEKNHGHAPGLVSKLKAALDHLPKVTKPGKVYQGDFMYHKDDGDVR